MREQDERLLTAAQAGDPRALEELLERYQPLLMRFGLRMCGSREDAEDIVQDSMLAAVRTLPEFRGDASVSTWLYTIARSFCIKKRRRSKFAPKELESLDAGRRDLDALAANDRSPEEGALDRELDDAVQAAMMALEPGQREILVLRDVEGLTAKEVASVTGLNVGAVKSKLHRARAALRRALEPVVGEITEVEGVGACPDIDELFSQSMEGEIDAELCQRMMSHVEACPRCKRACTLLNSVLKTCQATPAPQVPRAVQAAVRRAVRLSSAEG